MLAWTKNAGHTGRYDYISNKPNDVIKNNADSLIKQPTFFLLYKFSLGFYILLLLHIHCWFNIINIIPYSPDDGSLEPKRYSVDFASQ